MPNVIEDGGVFMWAALAVGAVHALLSLWQVAVARRRIDVLPLLWSLVAVSGLLAVGVVVAMERQEALAIAAAAQPVHRAMLAGPLWFPLIDLTVVLATASALVITTGGVHTLTRWLQGGA